MQKLDRICAKLAPAWPRRRVDGGRSNFVKAACTELAKWLGKTVQTKGGGLGVETINKRLLCVFASWPDAAPTYHSQIRAKFSPFSSGTYEDEPMLSLYSWLVRQAITHVMPPLLTRAWGSLTQRRDGRNEVENEGLRNTEIKIRSNLRETIAVFSFACFSSPPSFPEKCLGEREREREEWDGNYLRSKTPLALVISTAATKLSFFLWDEGKGRRTKHSTPLCSKLRPMARSAH